MTDAFATCPACGIILAEYGCPNCKGDKEMSDKNLEFLKAVLPDMKVEREEIDDPAGYRIDEFFVCEPTDDDPKWLVQGVAFCSGTYWEPSSVDYFDIEAYDTLQLAAERVVIEREKVLFEIRCGNYGEDQWHKEMKETEAANA